MQKERRPGTVNKTPQQPEHLEGTQRTVGDVESLNPSLRGPRAERGERSNLDPIASGKEKLHFTKHKGSFLRKCPGTLPGYLCCNYYVLNIQTNCNLDCHYCILQSYINNDRLTIYTNIEDALAEVEEFLKSRHNRHCEDPERSEGNEAISPEQARHCEEPRRGDEAISSELQDEGKDRFYRIGTGELTDSLSLDYLTNTSLTLVPFFIQQKNALLELKTKSDKIDNLLKFRPNGNIVVSWSLNPQSIIDTYEKQTASLTERLRAAKECLQAGYHIGFHLDPVILYPDWETGYRDLINQISKYIPPDKIIWISIAGFRCPQSLRTTIQERFPNTKLFTEEMIRAKDGKHRYLRPIRVAAYRKIINWIKEYDPDVPIYFCMESPTVWQDVFGKLPTEINNLKGIFGKPVRPIRLRSY